jgi:hypothetical protein
VAAGAWLNYCFDLQYRASERSLAGRLPQQPPQLGEVHRDPQRLGWEYEALRSQPSLHASQNANRAVLLVMLIQNDAQ